VKFVILCPFRWNSAGVFAPAVDDYLARLRRHHQVDLVASSSKAPRASRSSEDGSGDASSFYSRHLGTLKTGLVIALDEGGDQLDTQRFSALLAHEKDLRNRTVYFCLGSAYGLPANLAELGGVRTISLSGLTFCHELALTVLTEQIYRATTLLSGHPYHHAGVSPYLQERLRSGQGSRGAR
jgi:23S rRNA pseudoU1915 N3-methylase RlmH